MGTSLGKILIIDDVEMNRAILREAFIENYDILEAENGYVGLEQIEEHGDELTAVFLDIIMPELDGFGVLGELESREFLHRVPVFLITTEATEYVATKAYNYGVVDVISKPFNLTIIKRRVENIIELYAHRNKLESVIDKKQRAEKVERSRQSSTILRSENIQHAQWSIIETLVASLEAHNIESGKHIRRICRLTNVILRDLKISHPEYNLTDKDIHVITKAAALHDIGKIAIPERILLKPKSQGALSEGEFAIMKTHTTKGCELIEAIRSSLSEDMYTFAHQISRSHHERWDGKGYPDGLVKTEIPISAQAVSLSDAYNALVSRRPYKEAIGHEMAVRMINGGQCGAFNPDLLECFNKVIDGIYQEIYAIDFIQ
ncbi:MAG: response regulator [Spirochaetaceae bacterium]|nr:response regulator [Spirochaetaceae bacterium]